MPDTLFAHIAYLADRTESLIFATGIANVYHRLPGVTMQAANTLAEQTGDRFVLGLGVSHERTVAGLRGLDYSRPLQFMRDYLKSAAASPYSGPRSVQEVPGVVGRAQNHLPAHRDTQRVRRLDRTARPHRCAGASTAD